MNRRPRTVVFAYSEVGWRCLRALAESGANIRAVFTYKDDLGENTWFHSVKDLAVERGLPVFTPKGVKDAKNLKLLKEFAPELVFSFYYRHILPEEVLCLPRLGAFNMHGSLLPKYRGRACVNWAIIKGESETGATLHWMTPQADEGDIVAQKRVPIDEKDTAKDVMLRIAEAAEKLIREHLHLLESGKAPRTPQDHGAATCFGGRKPEDGLIDWNATAKDIANLVRAVTRPYPGAFSYLKGKKVFIWKAVPVDDTTETQAGKVITVKPLVVGTGRGLLRIDDAEPEMQTTLGDLFGKGKETPSDTAKEGRFSS
ncbi:MAG: formyltransferase [Thermovirgaceae bacterium]